MAEGRIATITAVLTLISTGLGIFITAKVQTLDAAIKDRQETRAERESLNAITMEVYAEAEKAVLAAPGEAGKRQQRAAAALVSALLKHDADLQKNLLEAIRQNSLPGVEQDLQYVVEQTQTNAQLAELKTREAPATDVPLENYDFDVFWCETSGAPAESAAKAISAQLKLAGARGQVRTRVLPDARNRDPGYRHNGFVVRFNAPDEDGISKTLAQIAGRTAKSVLGGDTTFVRKTSQQPTKWYLSAFVCPNALTAAAPTP